LRIFGKIPIFSTIFETPRYTRANAVNVNLLKIAAVAGQGLMQLPATT